MNWEDLRDKVRRGTGTPLRLALLNLGSSDGVISCQGVVSDMVQQARRGE